jgi:hypothetical protein
MMTWKILTIDTQRIIYLSLVRPVSTPDPNLHADMFGWEEVKFNDCDASIIIKSCPPSKIDSLEKQVNTAVENSEETTKTKHVFNPEDLIGRSFLMDEQDDGQRLRATVVKPIDDYANSVERNPTRLKFLL